MTHVFIRTFGCSLNRSDTEFMEGMLLEEGFSLADRAENAEVIVVNTCAVKQPTETKVLRYIEEAKATGRTVVAAGCMAKALPSRLRGIALVGPDNIYEIGQVIEEAMHANILRKTNGRKGLGYPRRFCAPVGIIPISKGCLGKCTYCIVRKARGRLRSYSGNDIVESARSAVQSGCTQIWLTSQDTGCYGMDTRGSLPALLGRVAALPGDFLVRVGMMNPDHALAIFDSLLDSMESPAVFKFLHMPVQSGSSRILGAMGRSYSPEDFLGLVGRFRQRFPLGTVSTDVICGFPGETEEDFRDTVRLIEKAAPDMLHISRFWPRPGTPAAGMQQVDSLAAKQRTASLARIFEWQARETNRKWLGWSGRCTVEAGGKHGTWVARNNAFRPIILAGRLAPGDWCSARVTGVTSWDLRGEIMPCQQSQKA